MKVIHKDATITPTGTDEDFPGTFEVVLSAPTEDRDKETLLPEEWKQPLPEHITFDQDHGMSVATTVGSGVPRIDEKTGNLIVSGTYSSLPRAQEVRTLVKEGHIRTTSVAYMSDRTTKDGKSTVKRELLNGAFVAIPSNREAVVMSSKALGEKVGARNSGSDMEHIQAIHDHAIALGAMPMDDSKAQRHATTKSVVGSLEATQDRARDALNDAYAAPQVWVWLRATLPDSLVFEISTDSSETEVYQQDYTDDGSVITLTGERRPVDVAEVVTSDPDEAADSGADVAPASGAAKAAPVAGASSAPAEDDSLEMQYRSLKALADAYVTE